MTEAKALSPLKAWEPIPTAHYGPVSRRVLDTLSRPPLTEVQCIHVTKKMSAAVIASWGPSRVCCSKCAGESLTAEAELRCAGCGADLFDTRNLIAAPLRGARDLWFCALLCPDCSAQDGQQLRSPTLPAACSGVQAVGTNFSSKGAAAAVGTRLCTHPGCLKRADRLGLCYRHVRAADLETEGSTP
jgi:hypothetical protein